MSWKVGIIEKQECMWVHAWGRERKSYQAMYHHYHRPGMNSHTVMLLNLLNGLLAAVTPTVTWWYVSALSRNCMREDEVKYTDTHCSWKGGSHCRVWWTPCYCWHGSVTHTDQTHPQVLACSWPPLLLLLMVALLHHPLHWPPSVRTTSLQFPHCW